MKIEINEIRSILKAQTCNLFSEAWYNKTTSLLTGLNKETIDNPVKIDSRFDKFHVGVRYYNSDLGMSVGPEVRNFLRDLESHCVMKGLILTRGKGYHGRFFIISINQMTEKI